LGTVRLKEPESPKRKHPGRTSHTKGSGNMPREPQRPEPPDGMSAPDGSAPSQSNKADRGQCC